MNFQNIQSFPTYWENGMKLSADHFQHLENSIEDAMRDSRAVGVSAMGAFGLLPYSKLELQNAEGTTQDSIRIVLRSCRAIMPGGHRVEILPDNITTRQVPNRAPYVDFKPISGTRYHIYLTVDEYERVATGKQELRPIRSKNLSPDYRLEVIAREKVPQTTQPTSNRLQIGEWKNGNHSRGYIPPTLCIRGYSILEDWFKFLELQLENIVKVSTQVIQQYRQKDKPRTDFCLPIVMHVKSREGHFRLGLPQQSPINLLAYFEDLAGLINGIFLTADRDFFRNHLAEGNINGLSETIERMKNRRSLPYEEMALRLTDTKLFLAALFSTINGLLDVPEVKLRSGDERIVTG